MHRSDAGLFGPGSATWQIHREHALMLGAGRALILQAAHPLVGAGISQHSRYLTDRWGRLTHTLAAMRKMTFGDAASAHRSAERIARAHVRVRGVVADGHSAGAVYDATDPALIMWVWASLVDTALLAYQRFVRPVPAVEAERYYQEQKRWAYACGMPPDHCPETVADFAGYVAATVTTALEATDAAHTVVAMALNPFDLPSIARPALAVLRLPTIGLLPPSLRDVLGLTWTVSDERLLRLLSTSSRAIVPGLPPSLRYVAAARHAAARTRGRATDADRVMAS